MAEAAEAANRHPSWSDLRAFTESATPSSHVIDGEPRIILNILGSDGSIELLVPFDGDPSQIAPLAEIETDVVNDGGTRQLRLRASDRRLFPLFYEFCLTVADLAQRSALPTLEAVEQAVTSWRRLLQGAALLSVERQTGLYGELLVLRRLQAALGAAALDAWTGPTGQAHDFRLGGVELEVKTTRGERRVHTINGATQLEASPEAHLFIVSILATAAGSDGESLSQVIAELRGRFTDGGADERFSELIEKGCSIPRGAERHYDEPLKLRSEMVLVPVDDTLPRITVEDLTQLKWPEMSRISDVHFRLDLEGLGWPDGSPPFIEVLPADST